MKILVFGTFDRLHPGHHFVFREAMARGDVTAVIALDDTVARIKGKCPTQSATERSDAIRKLFPQITVILGHPTDYLSVIRSIRPDLILLGYDQKLPPGVSEADLQVAVERLAAFEPQKYKSSLL